MAGNIVLGNGNILVALDKNAQVRDFYFPEVGSENHVNLKYPHKIGLWVDGEISWTDNPEWEFSIDYKTSTMASDITAVNNRLNISLSFLDIVYNEKNIFLRQIAIKNLGKKERLVKIYFNQQFQIYAEGHGNTAFFNPHKQSIVHYKGKRVFWVSGLADGKSFDDYCVGVAGVKGKEGTWKDAEEGALSKNAVEHGSVDSTIGFSLEMGGESERQVVYWITAGKYLSEAEELHDYILDKSPDHIMETTQDFWHAWVEKSEIDFSSLPKEFADLFKKSLLIMRTHVDAGGGIIASGDGAILQYGYDNYSYVWPRDASFVAMAFDKAGYKDIARRFFEFSNAVISKDGYFYHKYMTDGAIGSSWHPWIKEGKPRLPIQEDETAIVLYALWHHYEASKEIEFVESIYNSLIKKTADFLVSYRDKKTGLPQPSYDLWEHVWGISTYTSALTVAALQSASAFARLLGKEKDEKIYSDASKEIREAILKHLYDEKEGFFYKLINIDNNNNNNNNNNIIIIYDKVVDMSSIYGIFNFGILDSEDERFKKAYKYTEDRLFLGNGQGGVIRFEGDEYYRSEAGGPGNPWFITTLWDVKYRIKTAKKKSDLKKALSGIKWAADRALSSGIFSEQIDWISGQQLSVSPLIWSHAEYVLTTLMYLDKLKEFETGNQ